MGRSPSAKGGWSLTPSGLFGEDALLAACIRGLGDAGQGRGVVTGIGDDAAILTPPLGEHLVATVDMLVEGQHFLRGGPGAMAPEDLGWRMLAVNLSDIAAMGGRPLWALCSVGAPADLDPAELERLYVGLGEAARTHRVAVVGGNLARVDERLVLDVTVLGAASRIVRRLGAVPGDLVCVTGRLGAAAAGLSCLVRADGGGIASAAAVRYVVAAQRHPEPRVLEGQALAALEGVHAMCDVSDGLTRDLLRLCRPGLGAIIWKGALPIPPAVQAVGQALAADPVAWALHGGEDYELLCAVAPDRVSAAQAAVQGAGDCSLHVVGEFAPLDGLWLAEAPGAGAKPLAPRGWDPFVSPTMHSGAVGLEPV